MHAFSSSTLWSPRLLLALALTGAFALPVRAQAPEDGRWMAWIGCWQPSDPGAPVNGGQLCILPGSGPAVTFATVAAGKIVAERAVVADGKAHSYAEAGCRGSETFTWSADGHRLFRRTDMTCDGGTSRSLSGVLAFLPDDRWVQIEASGVRENLGLHVVHYGRWVAPADVSARLPQGEDLAVQTARTAVAAPLRIQDVIEANQKLDPMVLQHLVYERRNAYDLNASSLETLANAHVPSDVIDLMVALTYPQHFSIAGAVAQLAPRADTSRPGRGGYGGGYAPAWCFDNYGYYGYYRRAYLTSFGWWPFYAYGYGANGWYPSYSYYDPCYGGGFGPWGGYYGGGYYYPNGGVIVVHQGSGNGEAPNGGTYTGRTAHRRGDSSPSTGRSGSSAHPSSGSSGGSVSGSSGGSSGGSSSGSSSGSGGGGRTAHPRHSSGSPYSMAQPHYSSPPRYAPGPSYASSSSSSSSSTSSWSSGGSSGSSAVSGGGGGRTAHER